jgi:L-iditol 2-dehydrogenase
MYQKADYERAVELVSSGKMTLDQLVTHRFPFDRYLDAYQTIEAAQGEYLKVMIELD